MYLGSKNHKEILGDINEGMLRGCFEEFPEGSPQKIPEGTPGENP